MILYIFSPTQVVSMTQALRAEERVVTLEHGDKKWIVDLNKMEQTPVRVLFKFRQVRVLDLDSHFS